MDTEALAIVEAGTPMPVYSGAQMEQALHAYQQLQRALARSMPDQIMSIGDRRFRKKGYWRAIAVAFKLTVEPQEERREVQGTFKDGAENFGYILTYRATAPNGRATTGDGTAFAIEKAARFKCPHPHPSWAGKQAHFPPLTCPDYDPEHAWAHRPAEATEHNIRSHAHTRAFNRAVSNLVGFGEVSADEVDYRGEMDTLPQQPPAQASRPQPQPMREPGDEDADDLFPPPSDEPTISTPQAKRLWAIAKSKGWTDGGIKVLLTQLGYEHSTDVPKRIYDRLVKQIETDPAR